MNVRICAYGDLPQCREAVASVTEHLPDGVPIHVCDGRYATFDGETDLTPGLEAFCGAHPDCTYHAPPEEYLPFGWDRIADGTPAEWRPGVHAKAQWIDETLPSDEWTLKLDTDERLARFDADLETLDREFRYAPIIDLHGDGKDRAHVARLWVPTHWTRWADDCLLPRNLFPRDTSLKQLQRIWRDKRYEMFRFIRLRQRQDIHIDNYGAERPDAYQQRRADHLQRIGRGERL